MYITQILTQKYIKRLDSRLVFIDEALPPSRLYRLENENFFFGHFMSMCGGVRGRFQSPGNTRFLEVYNLALVNRKSK